MPMATKELQRAYLRKHYQDNKEKYIAKRRELRRGYKQEWEEYLATLSCVECGENHSACLDFHHLDPEKKEFAIGTKARYGRVKSLMKEIDKCIVLCANCHRKLHWEIRQTNSLG